MLGLVGQLIVRRQLELIDLAKRLAGERLRKRLSSLDKDGDGEISLGEMTRHARADEAAHARSCVRGRRRRHTSSPSGDSDDGGIALGKPCCDPRCGSGR